MKQHGLRLEEKAAAASSGKLSGKTFVFTGELTSFSRQQAQELIRRQGGDWASLVSKNTDFVVVGKDPGSKYDKAKELGIAILNEQDFKRLVQSP